MRFLLDQNIERRLAAYLREEGHDVLVVGVHEPAGLPDPEVLSRAHEQNRVLITKDRDFGELVVRHRHAHAGIIFLRIRARNFASKRDRLAAVLRTHADQLDQFLVVTDRQIRVRRTL